MEDIRALIVLTDHVCRLEGSILQRQVFNTSTLGIGNRLVDHLNYTPPGITKLLRITKRQLSIPVTACGNLLIQRQRLCNAIHQLVRRGIRTVKVLEVNTQYQFTDCLRAQLQHILIDVPCLARLPS